MDKVIYTEEEMALIDPRPGTAAAAARDFGIDLSLTVSNLRLKPAQRVERLDGFQSELKELRRAVSTSKRDGRDRASSEVIR